MLTKLLLRSLMYSTGSIPSAFWAIFFIVASTSGSRYRAIWDCYSKMGGAKFMMNTAAGGSAEPEKYHPPSPAGSRVLIGG